MALKSAGLGNCNGPDSGMIYRMNYAVQRPKLNVLKLISVVSIRLLDLGYSLMEIPVIQNETV